jgi:phosphohistidine phosphatase
MRVILVRHAEAGTRDPNSWPNDEERPLTPEGRKKQTAAARAMKKMEIEFDFLVTSPLVRARQTAEILAAAYGWKEEPQVAETLGPACTAATLVKLLAKFPPDAQVCLVGHEPSLSGAAAALTGRSGDARIELKKSGVIGLGFEGAPGVGEGTLLFVLRPSHLKKAAR